MKIDATADDVGRIGVDVLVVPVHEGDPGKDATAQALDKALGGVLLQVIKSESFTGRSGQTLSLHTHGRIAAQRITLVGLGKRGADASNALRVAATRATRAAQQAKHTSLALVLPATRDLTDAARVAAEGIRIGVYRFDRYMTGDRKPKTELATARIVIPYTKGSRRVPAAITGALAHAEISSEAVNAVRDLVNDVPNELEPATFAAWVTKQAKTHKVACTVLDKAGVTKAGMKLLLAVNQGSDREPRFVHLKWTPPKAKRRIVLVGKGITFDSGGLCIKPGRSMLDMKCDMAGAAVMCAVTIAAARLKLPIEVHGIAALTENMLSGLAYRPGDVFGSLDGKTVEIINTDAEGRLVLADALAYARTLQPDLIIDHATLTGACVVALGSYTAGVFGSDKRSTDRYLKAAQTAGENMWQLPLVEELRDGLKSDVADLKNLGEATGGAISAALFLREFVGEAPWIHVDIAGPAFAEKPFGMYPKGGTGFGVLTLLQFLASGG